MKYLLEVHWMERAATEALNNEASVDVFEGSLGRYRAGVKQPEKLDASLAELQKELDGAGLGYLIEGYSGSVRRAAQRLSLAKGKGA